MANKRGIANVEGKADDLEEPLLVRNLLSEAVMNVTTEKTDFIGSSGKRSSDRHLRQMMCRYGTQKCKKATAISQKCFTTQELLLFERGY